MPERLLDLFVFDIAGTTLVDPDGVNKAFREAILAAGIEATRDQINAVMGLHKPQAIRLLIEAADLTIEDRSVHLSRIDAIHEDFAGRMIAYYADDPEIAEVPGTSAVFRALKNAGVKIGLDTGFGRDITDVILKRLKWVELGLVDATVCSNEVRRGRPHPDMIERLKEVTGVADSSRVGKVGDTPSDLEEGLNSGCGLVVGVTEGTHTRDQLSGYAGTHLIGTVAELPALLTRLKLVDLA